VGSEARTARETGPATERGHAPHRNATAIAGRSGGRLLMFAVRKNNDAP